MLYCVRRCPCKKWMITRTISDLWDEVKFFKPLPTKDQTFSTLTFIKPIRNLKRINIFYTNEKDSELMIEYIHNKHHKTEKR